MTNGCTVFRVYWSHSGLEDRYNPTKKEWVSGLLSKLLCTLPLPLLEDGWFPILNLQVYKHVSEEPKGISKWSAADIAIHFAGTVGLLWATKHAIDHFRN